MAKLYENYNENRVWVATDFDMAYVQFNVT